MKYLRNNLSIRIRNIFLITCILLIVAFLTVFRSQNKDVQFAESLTTTKKSSSTEKSIKDHKDYLFYDSILYKNYTREYVIEETIKFASHRYGVRPYLWMWILKRLIGLKKTN